MIKWSAAFETGHPVIDNDHRRLVEALNVLDQAVNQGAAKEEMNRVIGFLNDYTRIHFAREEQYMQGFRCPHHAENRAAHAELIKKLDAWLVRLNAAGPSTSLVLEVYRETNQWVQHHILKVDCKIRGCAATHASAAR